MTQNEKQLLLKDLCARLPYGVMVRYHWDDDGQYQPLRNNEEDLPLCDINTNNFNLCYHLENAKPYLRPMSSMTEEEENEYRAINCYEGLFPRNEDALDYVLSHHLDYRGLIPMGLALEAKEGMYKTE